MLPVRPSTKSNHFRFFQSYRTTFWPSAPEAAMYLPSEDHRGSNLPCESGSVDTWWVFESQKYMAPLPALPAYNEGRPAKTSELPSGDQSGSRPVPSPDSISSGAPPL